MSRKEGSQLFEIFEKCRALREYFGAYRLHWPPRTKFGPVAKCPRTRPVINDVAAVLTARPRRPFSLNSATFSLGRR